ncbi:hypothetical protein SBA3_1900019 [Candidatus Sulfopaludibacter sp. SbA3]|nr:hypothetical protein SBA3_1900019 [Candidatus Sulfopaludibacter sp. SbA3]
MGGMKMGGKCVGIPRGQIRARHEDSPKGGEFRAWHGRFAKRRRISSLARICGGYAARDFRGWHGFAAETAPAPPGIFAYRIKGSLNLKYSTVEIRQKEGLRHARSASQRTACQCLYTASAGSGL